MEALSRKPHKLLNHRAPERQLIEKKLPEWLTLEGIFAELETHGQFHHLGPSVYKGQEFPLVAMSFGSKDPQAPVLGLFGGVHGLERIGTQVVLALMNSFSELLLWDEFVQQAMSKIRICFLPLINPWGFYNFSRSNPNGVDLMRNAPVESLETSKYFLPGGQSLSPKLPWYRGSHTKLESETQAVVDFCKNMFFQSQCVVTVDCHSGFGMQDQLWFPYAKTKTPFHHLPEAYSLFRNFKRTYPNHFYKIEPQAYTTHGDLWDYIYDLFLLEKKGVYIPLCLEMGSYLWVRKNPLQFFTSLGHYNPIKPHRQKRVLRRHLTFFDFLVRSLVAHNKWAYPNPEQRQKYQVHAKELWYERD